MNPKFLPGFGSQGIYLSIIPVDSIILICKRGKWGQEDVSDFFRSHRD